MGGEFQPLKAVMTPGQKRMLAVLVIGGGALGMKRLQAMVKSARAEQRGLSAESQQRIGAGGKNAKTAKVAVDARFFQRLAVILKICVPSIWSKEAGLIIAQGLLLVSRTVLTDYISDIEGASGRALVSLRFEHFVRSIMAFAAIGVPAAFVNSGLKYMQKLIQLAFQERLTQYLHKQYCSNRAYYAASLLGGLTNADQRITDDVEKFAFAVSELYSHTFKPLLDVILFTRSLARVMGYKSQFGLYVYYLGVAALLRFISPPLSSMSAQEATLSGVFRGAHQRLVTSAEEVAFNDPPAGSAEQMILNQHLRRLVRFSGLSAFQRFLQQIADGYFVKYGASVTALLVYAAPIYFKDPAARGSQGQLTSDYIRSMRLLQNTSRGVGDLIMIYKRISTLAAHTSRVSELLEKVEHMSGEDAEHKELFRRNVSSLNVLGNNSNGKGPWHNGGSPGSSPTAAVGPPLPPRRLRGPTIAVRRLMQRAPDGSLLARELTFAVEAGQSVMLAGPNGCGKSSLFRVLAGLWPLEAGEVTTPDPSALFYLSQRPYLVAGTLRDQLLYPNPPRAVWQAAKHTERREFAASSGRPDPDSIADIDVELLRCLQAVGLDGLLARGSGWDQIQNWNETLSGGEKQRLAMARLLYHKPRYAILDECTAAVSADGQDALYEECQKAGITFLSIAHRISLSKYHSLVIKFDDKFSGQGNGWTMTTPQELQLLETEGGTGRSGGTPTSGAAPSDGGVFGPAVPSPRTTPAAATR